MSLNSILAVGVKYAVIIFVGVWFGSNIMKLIQNKGRVKKNEPKRNKKSNDELVVMEWLRKNK